MGYITKISDYELQRGDPPYKGDEEKPVTKSKVVKAAEKKPPVSTTAVTKDAK